jgi:hypothetical protein
MAQSKQVGPIHGSIFPSNLAEVSRIVENQRAVVQPGVVNSSLAPLNTPVCNVKIPVIGRGAGTGLSGVAR